MEINDDKIRISHEEGWVVLRMRPDVKVWVDYGDSTICVETEDPMGALMDVSAAKRESAHRNRRQTNDPRQEGT